MTRQLIITADDFGLHPSYDDGILEAARAGAIDAISVMVLPSAQIPSELCESGVALGLHLEDPGAGLTAVDLADQLARFEALAGRPADYLDGHHHCHTDPRVATDLAEVAAAADLPVRSVAEVHRPLLREAGVRTPDLLIGRYVETDAVIPPELSGGELPDGWTEWMVHPGRADPSAGSGYDAGREEDLIALLSFQLPAGVRRSDHRRLPCPQ